MTDQSTRKPEESPAESSAPATGRGLPMPQPPHTPRLVPGADNVIVTDWPGNRLRFGVIVYFDELPMPSQEGIRQGLLYEFERQGWLVVREAVEMPE